LLTVHVVSHTHWDREWYHPAERFRQRLVRLVDELLDEPQRQGAFLLDGQTAVLEDYLEVRPERASELSSSLRERRLEAGPWFVLADELIPGAEGLIRNLLAGRRTLRALRAEAPPVLYCPDSFGHPGAIPELARGFDKSVVVVWRGLGGDRAPKGDTIWWSAASGERVLLYHLTKSGYELGANLPVNADRARDRWKSIRGEFDGRPITGLALLLNGADHHAPQRDIAAALDSLRKSAGGNEIIASSLSSFAAALPARAGARRLPEVRGELRDSYGYTWTLQGTLASRAPQKRRYALSEQELVRDVEPWTALATFYGKGSRRHLAQAAWRSLLLCQPHDTLCGCSIDQVARAMDTRLDSVASQAQGLREDALLDLVGHDRDEARRRAAEWRDVVLVRNRAPRVRSGVAIVQFSVKLKDVPVGPGSHRGDKQQAQPAKHPTWPIEPTQPLDAGEADERIEAPRSYPDNDRVARLWSAVWVENAPPYGVVAVPTGADESPQAWFDNAVVVKGRSMSNGRLSLRWDSKGRVTLATAKPTRVIRGLIEWESRSDEGDLYTPAIRRLKLKPRLTRADVVHRGPLSAALEQLWVLQAKQERVEVRLRLVLDAGAGFVRIGVLGDNSAIDHRLRLVFRTDVNRGVTVADAAFGPVERAPLNLPAKSTKTEKVVPTAPLHRYVSLFNAKRGATLYSDGLTEYEILSNGFAVTLLRAVGELSRADLPERPGHAGWPSPTPEAQCVGPFEAEFGLLLHGARSAATTHEIERVADDVLFPLVGESLRSALRVAPPVHGVELNGAGLALSAIKESEDGEWLVLRCVNNVDEESSGSWRLGRAVKEAKLARLDETPLTPLAVRGDTIRFLAPSRGVVTILAR
jgi:mannosylglycerate hydrolase